MIEAIKSDETLLRRLMESARLPVSKVDADRQRVSFVYGNLPADSGITREHVEKRIRDRDSG